MQFFIEKVGGWRRRGRVPAINDTPLRHFGNILLPRDEILYNNIVAVGERGYSYSWLNENCPAGWGWVNSPHLITFRDSRDAVKFKLRRG